MTLYHGSPVHGIKTLVPNNSTHGKYIYATSNKDIAIVMSAKYGDDALYSFGSMHKNGPYDLVERVAGVFEKIFANEFSLYTLDESSFKDIHTGFNEVVSEEEVDVISEEYYPNVFDEIKRIESEGRIKIYRYPDRPENKPIDDSDLVEKVRRNCEVRFNENTYNSLCRWIFLHPNLEDDIRLIANNKGFNLPSYDEIKESYIERQNESPDKEYFLEEAAIMKDMCKQRGR